MKRIRIYILTIALILIIVVAGLATYLYVTNFTNSCATTPPSNSVASSSSNLPSGIQHVIIIMEENQAYCAIVGSSEAPYMNQLISNYSLLTNYFAISSKSSLSNYFGITGGSSFGMTADCNPSPACEVNGTNTNIGDLLNSKGLSWKEYAESMPSPCYLSDGGPLDLELHGLYAVRHDPFVYYSDISSSRDYCDSHVVPFENSTIGFLADLESGNLPNYSLVIPNLCDDGHDLCSVNRIQQTDNWLSNIIPKIISSKEFNSTIVFITYDSGSSSSNQVINIIISPFVVPGSTSDAYYTHYSTLSTIEAIFNLANMGRGDNTTPIEGIWK